MAELVAAGRSSCEAFPDVPPRKHKHKHQHQHEHESEQPQQEASADASQPENGEAERDIHSHGADSQTAAEHAQPSTQHTPGGGLSAPPQQSLRALSAAVPAWVAERASTVSPEVVAIASVYFVQGVLGLARLAVTFLLKDDFGLDPAEGVLGLARLAVTFLLKDDFGLDPAEGVLGLARLAVTCLLKDDFGLDPAEVAVLSGLSSLPWLIKPIYGFMSDGIPLFGYRRRSYLVACLSSLPWLIKPIYGFISDGIPLFGYRRRSYLVACGLLGSVAWGALASVVGDKYSAVAMILLSSLSAAVSDVVSGAMRCYVVLCGMVLWYCYRRRSYLVACGLLLGSLTWGALASVVGDKYSAVAMILLSSLSAAVSDVVSGAVWCYAVWYCYPRRSYLVACGLLLGSVAWGGLASVVGDKYSAVAMILLSSLSAAVSPPSIPRLNGGAEGEGRLFPPQPPHPALSPGGGLNGGAEGEGRVPGHIRALPFICTILFPSHALYTPPHHPRPQVVDSMVVQRARGESQATSGGLQSLCWGSSAVGAVLSAYFSGSLIENYGTRFVFGVTALLPLITTAVGFYIPEERVTTNTRVTTDKDSTTTGTAAGGTGAELGRIGEGQGDRGGDIGGDRDREGVWEGGALGGAGGVVAAGSGARETWAWAWGQVVFLWETIRQPAILLPTAFIFLWQATPHSETAMFFFTTNELGFGPEFLGRVRLVTALASLAGVGVFNFCLKEVPLRKLFLWTNVAGALLGSTQLLLVTGLNRSLGISDQYFLLGDSLILTVLGQVRLQVGPGAGETAGGTWGSDQYFLPEVSLIFTMLGQVRAGAGESWGRSPSCQCWCWLLEFARPGIEAMLFATHTLNNPPPSIPPPPGQISFMPVLVLAARVCPPGIEATLFATLMSVSNGASVFGGVMGAGLTNWLGVTSTNFTNLPTLIAICNFSSLLVLPFLNLLPATVSTNSDSEEE
ncbi:unnamed protein product [Closterium sp. Naga37s-1]|nr:unnamed protein product [Closterium sp. Naga37s-1]